ncbi:YdcF family protein [Rhodocista pekingensis]|uniref:YdcF family protein n=1 Tax=Rhodocista pekingensis TaxID=201185 RepID=A0ABW2KPT6_9PROT
MSFILSKLFWTLAAPGNALLLILLAGMGFMLAGWQRTGLWLAGGATVALTAVAALPVGAWMLWSLESRFPSPATLPERVDGIIVLGGAVRPILTADRGQPALNEHAERLTEIPALAQRYPEARVVFTGGSGLVFEQDLKEAPVARAAWERMGFDTARVLFEQESRNTWENAVLSRDLAHPLEGEVWLLVTSALHMPRSVGIFRRIGWNVVAYPVDFQVTDRSLRRIGFDLTDGLRNLSYALHEYIGLAVYRWLDRTDALLPGPGGSPADGG